MKTKVNVIMILFLLAGLLGITAQPAQAQEVTYSVSGKVWNDLNGDGIMGADEPGLQGWEVRLFKGGNGGWYNQYEDWPEITTITGEDGTYTFTDLPWMPNTQEEHYCLALVMQDGWRLTSTYWVAAVNPIENNPTNVNVGVNLPPLQFSPTQRTLILDAGDPVDLTITVSGGTPPYTFDYYWNGGDQGLTVAANPDGLSFSVSGTPEHTTEIVLTAYDTNGVQVSATYRFEVTPAPMTGIYDLTSSANPSEPGQQVTFSLTGTSEYFEEPFGTLFPIGLVEFLSNGTVIPGCEMVFLNYDMQLGVGYYPAICTTDSLTAGVHNITTSFTPFMFTFKPPEASLSQIVGAASYSISGTVFYDTNENGVMDVDETAVDFTDPALQYTMITVRQDCDLSVGLTGYPISSTDGTYSTWDQPAYHSYCLGLEASSWSRDYRITNAPLKINSLEANTVMDIGLAPAKLSVTPATLPPAGLNQPYMATITISGGTPPYTLWDQPMLPIGVTAELDPWAGTITLSGTPTEAGGFGGLFGIRDDMYVYAYYSPFLIVRTLAEFELTSSLNPASVGEEVIFSLAGTGLGSDYLSPNGDVTFYADGTPIAGCENLKMSETWQEDEFGQPVFIDHNPVICKTSVLEAGDHTITADFSNSILYYDATVSMNAVQTILSHVFTWSAPILEGGTGIFTAALPGGAVINGWTRSTYPGGSTCDLNVLTLNNPAELIFGPSGDYQVCLNWRLGDVTHTDQQTVTVENVAPLPIENGITLWPEPSVAGSPLQDSGSAFFDVDDLVSCMVNFGDNTGDLPGTVDNSEHVCVGPAHTYTSAGTYTITFTAVDTDGASGTATASHIVVPAVSADLSLSISGSKDPVKPGASLVYTLTVKNLGPDTAQNLTLTDKLDINTSFGSVLAPKGWTCKYFSQSTTLTCSAPSLTSGSSAIVKITVTVSKTARVGKRLVNTALVSSETYDLLLTNNTASLQTMVTK